ncbi:outer membrane beta-barrel protein [Fastidiosibacter lacustris]|uniref:outer membrane beta-barrel protein n=1 Tax=Fastidiosibacter lacustris TaxID=2056695 RepID=UPI000E3438C7|nr:outer membrane beta-barrel protein [Fastidiosibacter lacustris]
MRIFKPIGFCRAMHRVAVISLFAFGSVTIHPLYAASYRLEPINDLSSYYQANDHQDYYGDDPHGKNDKSFLGGTFNYSIPQASLAHSSKSSGHYGFGVFGGQAFYLNQKNLLGYQIGLNANAKSSFAQFGTLNRQVNVSLYDLYLLGQYHFAVSNTFLVGISVGAGYVYGWVENNPAIGYFGRFEPIVGAQMAWSITNQVALNASYLHYFGVASDRAYQSRQASPSIDRISIGVSYVF